MTEIELNQPGKHWQLIDAEMARMRCVHTSRMSAYLSGVTRISCSLALHIEAVQLLSGDTRAALFEQRVNCKAHC